ncbi:MAG: aminotransferase class I/II-fold pyridoxal phosphate-dependent enzyme [Chloroflexi bacterium]|nr:MAG: aminotransferase class I/II-fold pyridoxal phosphate-dependent enzyme [Chloroflexota bacterium]TMF10936.1 MAG: aminotransferase class I/II-fold pyridoxal phosphate-dependent enzyme [Chloroflexota bacterium]
MPRTIELRSDTFTLPTEAMRAAMAAAEVGDDVWDEDPTIHRLQQRAAEMVGKEASLFVPSGTMGNLCALLSHTQPGQEVILEIDSHIFQNEVAGASVVGGLQLRPLDTRDGRLEPEQVRRAIRLPDIHEPATGLLCLENTHNRKGGTCLSPAQTSALSKVAHEAGFPVHLDGARVFNAAVAQRLDVRRLTDPVDSVMFCLSKGLSAPVGSMLAGSSEFIERARRMRKMLGGGMRQAGVVAAAGLVALDEMVDRLAEDHANARRLAEGLIGLPGVDIDLSRVETNMVFGDCRPPLTATSFIDRCRDIGVLLDQASPYRWRMVTHRGVSVDDVEYAVEAVRRLFGAPATSTLRAAG